MGREIRRVPAKWEHPKDESGKYKPMYDEEFDHALADWLTGYRLWKRGKHPDQLRTPRAIAETYWEWNGAPPNPEYYYPKLENRDWYQVYETVSEGTPVTPPFETKQELIDYLVDNGDYWDQRRGDGGWPRENAEQFVEREWSPSLLMISTNEGTKIMAPRDGG